MHATAFSSLAGLVNLLKAAFFLLIVSTPELFRAATCARNAAVVVVVGLSCYRATRPFVQPD